MLADRVRALLGIHTARAAPLPKAKDRTDTLAQQIARLEGYTKTGTLADRQRNPGNLRFVGQKGATRGDRGFARFPTHQAGWTALRSQILLDAGRGISLDRFIYKYAPPQENNTASYLRSVSRTLGVNPTALLKKAINN